jgi:peptidoglycan/LPS O-acetylase OafA/YrhL
MSVQQPHLSRPKYRPEIDGLRAVAVLVVVAFHAFPSWVRGGFIGVDVFFVISGYLISTIIFENLDRGTFSFTEFYARRIKRIFPALLLVLITCFAFGWFALLADEYKQLGKHIAAGAGFISNFILWDEAGYFDNSAETKPLLHLWSLGIEEQFYIVWPLFLWFAWKRKFNLLTITIVVTIATFILNMKGVKQDMVATFYSPQTRFWELLSGSLLAWVTLYKKGAYANIKHKLDYWLSCIVFSEKQEADGKALSNVLSFVGLLLLVYCFWRFNKELSFPGKWALVPVLGAVLIITAGSKAWVNRTILSNKVTVWFGLISFPLYLWHWPLLSFARIVEGEVPSCNIRIAVVVLSVALAWLTYKLVERPIRFGKHGKAKVAVLVALMAIIGYVGYNTYSRDGLSFRLISKINIENSKQLNYKFPSTKECKTEHPYATASCYQSERKYPTTIALIGDSHMEALTHGFKRLFDNGYLGFNVIAIGKSGCNPFLNTDSITFKKNLTAVKISLHLLLRMSKKEMTLSGCSLLVGTPLVMRGRVLVKWRKSLCQGLGLTLFQAILLHLKVTKKHSNLD